MSFEVALEQFSGPFELLLQLIEQEELSITDVSLSRVTESFLQHIDKTEATGDELADFLLVATKLLLIKSRILLPVKDAEEEDTSNLALQLKMYKEFAELSKHIEKQFNANVELFPREKADVIVQTELVIPDGLSVIAMEISFSKLLKHLEPFFKLQHVAMERVMSVKERLQEIREAIMERARFSFREILGSGHTKVDVVISFLALLELVKQRVVNVVQSDSFSDIDIHRVD